MPLLDLTDDEVEVLTLLVRQTLDYARYPMAPRLDPLKVILAKLDPPSPYEPLPPLPASAGPSQTLLAAMNLGLSRIETRIK